VTHAHHLARLLLVFAVVGGKPGMVQAAGDDGKEQAKALFDSGMQAYQRGDFASALHTFSAAYAAFPSSKLLFNVGQAALNLGRDGEAADAFQRFLEAEAATADGDDRRVAFARKAMHDLRTRKKIAEVKVHVEPAEATLELDGERVVRPTFFVNRGEPEATHVLKGRAPGFADAVISFTVQGTHAEPVAVVLAPVKAGSVTSPPPRAPSNPAPVADVPRAPAPKLTEPRPTEPAPAVVVAQPGTASSSTMTRTPAYATLGAAGGMLVVGLGYGGWVGHRAGQISGCGGATLSACASQGNADARALKTQAYIVDALFAGAAVAGTVGAILFFVAPTPGGGAAGVEGSF
jgi:hypothetical protein